MDIPNNWIPLDTCSSGNIFKSRELVTELKKDKSRRTTVTCNAGEDGEAAQESPRYNIRPHREQNYDHLFAQKNYRTGLKAFGSEAIEAIKKEMKQLHTKSDLSWKQRGGALV